LTFADFFDGMQNFDFLRFFLQSRNILSACTGCPKINATASNKKSAWSPRQKFEQQEGPREFFV
jgi:hypothetical protein